MSETFDAGTVEAELNLERRNFQRDLKETRRELKDFSDEEYKAQIGLELQEFSRDLKRANEDLRQFGRQTARASLGLDTAEIKRNIASAEAEIKKFGGKSGGAKLQLDTVLFNAQLGWAREQLRKFSGEKYTVKLGVEMSGVQETRARLAVLSRPRSATLNVDADTGKAQSKILGLMAQLAAMNALESLSGRTALILVGVLGLLGAAVAVLGTALAGLPGLLFAVAAPVLAVMLGVQGLKNAVKLLTPAIDALKKRLSDTFEKGFTPIMIDLRDKLLPGVSDSLNAVSLGMVFLAQRVSDYVTSALGMSQINDILFGTSRFIAMLAPGIVGLTGGLLVLGAEGVDALQRFTQIFNWWGFQFEMTMTRLKETNKLGPAFDNLGRVVGSVLDLFTRLIEAGVVMMAGPFGKQIADAFQAIGDAIIRVMPFFEAMGRLFITVGSIVGPPLLRLFDLLTPVINGLSDALSGMSQPWKDFLGMVVVGVVVLGPLIAAVAALAMSFLAVPVLIGLAVGAAVGIIWWLVANWSSVMKAIGDIWNGFAGWFADGWNGLWGWVGTGFSLFGQSVAGTWNWLIGGIVGVWNGFTGWFADGWNGFWGFVGTGFRLFGEGVVGTWNWLITGIVDLWNGFWGWFGGAWNGFWQSIVGGFWGFIGSIKDAFWNGVDFIARVFDTIRGLLARPVNFVIDTVYNKGLRGMWQKVGVEWLHLPPLPEAPLIPGFARGGPILGGTPGKDSVPILTMPGEYVWSKPAVDNAGGLAAVDAMHSSLVGGRTTGQQVTATRENQSRADHGQLVGFAPGGGMTWPLLRDIAAGFGATMTSGYRPGDSGYHGAGQAVDLVGDGGFVNIADNIFRRYPNATQIISAQWRGGTGVLNGQPHFYAKDNPEHTDHVHWAMTPNALGGGVDGGDFTAANPVAVLLHALKHGITDPLRGLMGMTIDGIMPGDGGPTSAKGAVKAGTFKMYDDIVNWVDQKVDDMFPPISFGSGGGIASANPDVVRAVQETAASFGWGQGPEWDALSWIISHESGWNPNAKNPTSTAYGLFQFLDSTWASTGIGKTSNPGMQALAGMRYIRGRYADPIGAQRFWQANHWYDDGIEAGAIGQGTHKVTNWTGRNEYLARDDQLGLLFRKGVQYGTEDLNDGGMEKLINAVVNGGGGGPNVEINNYDSRMSTQQMARDVTFELRHAGKGVNG